MAPAQKKGSADKAWTQRGASPVEGEIATPFAKTPAPRTTSATAMIRRPTRTTDETDINRLSAFELSRVTICRGSSRVPSPPIHAACAAR
jgi:hypothetical protein